MKIPPPTIERLVWDAWNLEHIQKHGVTPDEVEDVFGAHASYAETYKSRLLVTGMTVMGRILSVVIGQSPDVPGHWYVFSARPASRKERARYGEDLDAEDVH